MLKKYTPKEVMLDLLDDIERGRIEIDMTEYASGCKTPSCIAGHIVFKHGDFPAALDPQYSKDTFSAQAGKILRLTHANRGRMFLGWDGGDEYTNQSELSPLVPDMIAHWIQTGEVVWSK